MNYYKYTFSDVVIRYGGGEAFCSLIIMSQSFSEPVPLDCELHNCFSVSPVSSLPSLGGTEWVERAFPFSQVN